MSSFAITEGRPIVRQLTRKCCRDLERITAKQSRGGIFLTSFVVSFYGAAGLQGRTGAGGKWSARGLRHETSLK
jgi:hypothetical protein